MKRLVIYAGILLLILQSCTSVKITSAWRTPEKVTGNYKKILVMALSASNDNELREKMENHLVGDLVERGFSASSAYAIYGPKTFDTLKEKEALDQVKNEGFDAIITITLLNKTMEMYYMPRSVYYSPYSVYYNWWFGYYSTMYQRIYMPGYYDSSTDYFWESNLYDASSMKLVYSVQTKSFDPASTEALAHQYGKLILTNMIEKGVLTH